MVLNRRLIATFAYKAAGAVPKVLYLGHDADEARTVFEAAKGKGYFEIRVCRDIDLLTCVHIDRYRPDPVLARSLN